MVDVLGWRKKFGVLAPSTNTIVEPDFHAMAVRGVTSHMSRIHIRDQDLSSDTKMLNVLQQIDDELFAAIERMMTAGVDYLIMAMSAETFWGGSEGNKAFVKRIEDFAGLRIASCASAYQAALEAFKVNKIAVITPYQAVADDKIRHFFSDIGVEVVRLKGLRCPTALAIAEVSEDTLRQHLQELDGDDVEAIVQMGTNLSMLRLADEAERWLGKPVIAVNAATWWYALRQNEIGDRVYGCGRLLREF
ncbi:maleate cis-trans isomerase family protein [Anabaena azotica]|uniref:Arylmalonate decarboxylase n=1 Tax=Anabaena azotica FACHB-119 TaxID=947527 RepID=A0ABR8D083_9NOST|nr:arylmalonate decarboxylase [Anabaena azotica]MBD2500594.1 arylmalonate decarboxylase [Anabaena azotica FACHB-119]